MHIIVDGSLKLHVYTLYVMLLVYSFCLDPFRFRATHAVGVPGCALSSSTGWHMELVFVVDGLVVLLA